MNTLSFSISSSANPKIKLLLSLMERRERKKTHLFVIEGYRELKRAFDAGVEIQTLFYSEKHFLKENEPFLIEGIKKTGADVFDVDPRLFEKISYRDRPDGLIAIAKQMQTPLEAIEAKIQKKKAPPFLLIAESIEKPGNLGTILRSCDAVGVDGVIVCDPCTDIYNPNVVRASVGTLFTLPVVEESKERVFAWLKEKKIAIVAATPSASLDYTKAPLQSAIAIAVGTEQTGLSDLWMQSSDIRVKIPMRGVADSLNVATATTLLLYETLRQRCPTD